MTELVVPTMGEGIVEVRIVAFAKQPGDEVAKDEVLYELEHDKAAFEMESPWSGVLSHWLVCEGDTVAVGSPVAVILPEQTDRSSEESSPGPEATDAALRERAALLGAAPTQVRIPPRTRLAARRSGLTETELSAVSTHGAVLTPDDVQGYLERRAARPQGTDLVAASDRQQQLNAAMRLSAVRIVPATVAMPLDADALDALVRATDCDSASPLQAFAQMVARTAADHPLMRSQRLEDDRLVVRDRVDLGVAVDAEGGELTVAVISAADRLTDQEFSTAYLDAVDSARQGRAGPLATVPLIVTHLGDGGATFALPVIVQPAVATLFLGAKDAGTRQMVLTFDHCVMNGQQAVDFLTAVRDAVLRHRQASPMKSTEAGAQTVENAPAFAALIAPGAESGEPLATALSIAATVLGHPVDPDQPLGEQGMDSAASLQLTTALNSAYGIVLPATAIWRRPRLRQLMAGLDISSAQPCGLDGSGSLGGAPLAPAEAGRPVGGPGQSRHDIAVIGMSCRVPGADDVDSFWSLIEEGECRIGPVPPMRVRDLGESGRAALFERIDMFDAEFFGITPRQAAAMDPQQRFLLETSWHALQDAGIVPTNIAGSDIGVFVVGGSYDYRERQVLAGAADSYSTIGTLPAFLANRISHTYDLSGPSVTIDTACSGGLTAVSLAVAALRNGDCSMAFVGAANLLSSKFNMTAYRRAGMLSPHGHSHVFDARADGFVRGEGVGWVVLKPLQQARADGDPILAVMRGCSINHGGRGAALTAPNPDAQARLIRHALEEAGLPPSALGYVEAHGTGTALGDPIEIDALLAALADADGHTPQRAGGPDGKVWIGSVKSAIGHLEGASGLMGMIKAVQVLQHGVIPANPGFSRLNPNIDIVGTPLSIADRRISWPAGASARVAAVSAFGFGGSNAHVVLAEPEGGSGARSSLPLQQFRRKPFWLPEGPSLTVDPTDPIADHVVDGERILPAAAFLAVLSGYGPVSMRDVRFLRSVQINGPIELQRRSEGEAWVVLADCAACTTAEPGESGLLEKLDDGEAPGSSTGGAGLAAHGDAMLDLYQILAARAVRVGPAYRLVTDLHRSGRKTVCSIRAPRGGDVRQGAIAWLDAVLQCSHAVVSVGGCRIASGIDEFAWTGTVPQRAKVRLSQQEQPDSAQNVLVDIDVPGCLRIRGLRLAEMRHARAAVGEGTGVKVRPLRDGGSVATSAGVNAPGVSSAPDTTGAAHILAPCWRAEPAPAGASAERIKGIVLDDALTAPIRTEVVGPRLRYDDPTLAEMLARGLSEAQSGRGDEAVEVWLLVGGAAWSLDAAGVTAARGWLAALLQIGRILQRTSKVARVRLVTTGLAAPHGTAPGEGAALQGTLLGALRSLPRELPTIGICAVDLPPSAVGVPGTHGAAHSDGAGKASAHTDALISAVAAEPCGREAPLVAVREARYRQTLEELPVDGQPEGFREQGSYLVLGGRGGIGSRIVEHLAERYSARLLVVGRSVPDGWFDDLSARVRAAGGSCHYQRGDMTEPGVLAAAVAQAQTRYGRVDGIVHAVASVRSGRLDELTMADVDAVLATKVEAVIEARRLIGDGLLVLSSSVAGIFGSQGGFNYAAANSFLGSYAEAAAAMRGPTCAIDWGLWHDVGLASRYAGQVVRSYPGIKAFSATDGLHALETAVAQRQPHSVVWAGRPAAADAFRSQAGLDGVEAANLLDRYARAKIGEQLRRLDIAGVELAPEHRQLVASMRTVAVDDPGTAQLREGLLAQAPDLGGHVRQFDQVLSGLDSLLHGEKQPSDLLFPQGDLSGVEDIYSGNRLFDPVNEMVAEAAADALDRAATTGRRLRILEIGAGVGGTTAAVLPMLSDEVEYHYTDLSAAFLRRGSSRFGERVQTATLDIERDPVQQGFPAGGFDLVLAANVLHATDDLDGALENIKTLLAPGGRLVLAEMVAPSPVYTVIFGVTKQWWSEDERRLPHGPLLARTTWEQVLAEHGLQATLSEDVVRPGAMAVITCTQVHQGDVSEDKSQTDTVAAIAQQLRKMVRLLTADSNAPMADDAPWQELGIDSLLNNEFVATLSRQYGPLPATTLFEHRTIGALAAYLAGLMPDEGTRSIPASEPAASCADPVRPLVTTPSGGWTPSSPSAETTTAPVAVIGLAGRYPGARDVDAFWDLLHEGRTSVREVPADRWDWRTARALGGGYGRWGCFLEDWDLFDPAMFRLTPRDAANIDPQERLFLQVALEAFETAGYARRALVGRPVGVFAGVTATTHLLAERDARREGADNPGYAVSAFASVANRVSHVFDLNGPSLAIDTMCSSSLTAVHLACEAVRSGDAEMALAGGVNLYLHPDRFAGLCSLGMMSRGSRTKAFGTGADGFVPGEGTGAVVLKRLDQAEADGDTVYAVILGSAVNHGGGAGGYTVPNPHAQAELIATALRRAGVAPTSLQYLEAHGTGTALGDPIELRAAMTALGSSTPLRVGSVKPNIGHGEAVAGIAGLTKTILQLHHGRFVPTLHARPANPALGIDGSALQIQHVAEPWPAPDNGLRRAGVSSFGAGGANAHVVLGEHLVLDTSGGGDVPADGTRVPVTIPLSAPDPQRLVETARRLSAAMTGSGLYQVPDSLEDLAHTLMVGRDRWRCRALITCHDRTELAEALRALAAGAAHPSVLREDTGVVGEDERLAHPLDAQGRRLRRVALPTTPLARDVLPTSLPGRPLALLDEVLAPRARTGVLTLSDRSRQLQDHMVEGKPTLPGAIHPEVVYETLLAAGRSPYLTTIEGLGWPEPAVGAPMEVDVELAEDGTTFTVRAAGVVVAEGQLVEHATMHPDPYDTALLQELLSGALDGQEVYRALADVGFSYGRHYRTVRKVHYHEDTAVALLALPDGEDEDGQQLLHPALLDGAFQAAAYLLVRENPGLRHRPIGVDRITMYGPATDGLVCIRRAAPQCFDLTMLDKDGHVTAEIMGFRVHTAPRQVNSSIPVSAQTVSQPIKPDLAVQYATAYRIVWQHEPEQETAASAVAIIGTGPLAAAATALVEPADADEIVVDATWLESEDTEGSTAGPNAALDRVVRLFEAVKDLVRQRDIRSVRAHLVVAVDAGEGPETPLASAAHGLVRTLAAESARLQARLATVDRDRLARPETVLAALTGDPAFRVPSWIHLGAAGRTLAVLARAEDVFSSGPVRLRPSGRYLLVGGAGGFGQQVAAAILTQEPTARLLLVGRSPSASGAVEALRAMAPRAEVVYQHCDVTDREQVAALASNTPDVCGIVHLAGVLRDGFLRTKEASSIREVCAVKMVGVAVLDEAFAEHQLDFFVLCSSLAVWAGNQGQADYACANGYLDGFAARRERLVRQGTRVGTTLAVGWPIIANVGMSPRPESLRFLEETLGLRPWAAPDAAQTLLCLLAGSNPPYLALVHGESGVWESALEIVSDQVPASLTNVRTPSDACEGLVRWLQERVGRVTGVDPAAIDPDRDLLDYGIDSVTLIRLNQELERDLGRLPMQTLLDEPTIRTLANRIRTDHYGRLVRPSASGPDTESPARDVLAPQAMAAVQVVGSATEEGLGALPDRLYGIWLADQTASPAVPYVVSMAWRLPEPVDVAAMREAVATLVVRHPVLGCAVVAAGEELRFSPAEDIPVLQVRDTSGPLDEVLRDEAERGFQLADEALLRVVLWRSRGEHPVLQVVTHHLVADGRSAELIHEEIAAVYKGAVLPTPGSLGDALRDERRLSGTRLNECEAYWSAAMVDGPEKAPFVDAETDLRDMRGAHLEYRWPTELSTATARVAARAGCTPFVVLLAAVSLAVARSSGLEEFLISVPTYGRGQAEYGNTVGCFVRPVPVVVRMDRSCPVERWLDSLHRQVRKALSMTALPYASIIQHCRVAPTVTFAYQNWPRPDQPVEPLGELVYRRGQQGHFPLGIEITDTGRGIDVLANHQLTAVSSDEVERIVADVRRMLVELDVRARSRVGDLLAASAGTLVDRIAAVADRQPDAVAVEADERSLSYRQMMAASAQIADGIQEVAEGSPVAVLVDRDVWLPSTLLGVQRSDHPYLPLSADYPPQKIADILEEAGCGLVLVDEDLAGLLPETVRRRSVQELLMDEPLVGNEAAADAPRPESPRPDDLAYLIFTSGSTGRPKGVGVSHGAVVHTLDAIADRMGFGSRERLLAATTVSFDISVLELFMPLLVGATVVVTPRTAIVAADELAEELVRRRITTFQATPTSWQMLVETGWLGKPDLVALCGGERLPASLAATLAERTRALWNVYGPTETTIWSTMALIDGQSPVHLGDPIGATDLVVVPEGELWIGGPSVAAGYWRREDLTGQSFRHHPLRREAGGRYYRTGDLVRRDEAGRLLFLGRADDQVKIRGHRVELAEIESVLDAFPGITGAVAVPDGDGVETRLVAVVSVAGGRGPVELADLREFAATRLPSWMLPERVVVVDALPTNANGKVNRAAAARELADNPGNATRPAASIEIVEPTAGISPVGERATQTIASVVTACWAAVLGSDEAPGGRTFFEAGGNSLLLGRLWVKLSSAFPDAGLGVGELFSHPTVEDLVQLLVRRVPEVEPAGVHPSPEPRSRRDLRRAFRQEPLDDKC